MRSFAVPGAFLIVLFVGGAFASTVRAIDIRVDNVRGDDLRDGGSKRGVGLAAGPVRTIKRALELAHAGDRIVLTKNDEPYRESVTLEGRRHGQSESSPLILEGQGAVLDGTKPVPPEAWRVARKHVYQFDPLIRSTGLLYRDGVPVPRPASGRPGDLQPGEGTLSRGQVWFRLDENMPPSMYDLRWTAHSVGLTLYEVHGVEIRNLVVQGFALDGVNLHDGATDVRLVGVTLRGNGRSGLHVGGASRATLAESHVSHNGRAQLHVEGAGRLDVRQCELLNEYAPVLEREGGTVTGDLPAPARQAQADFVDRLSRTH